MFKFLKKLDEKFAQTEEGSRFADITSQARAAGLCEYGMLTAVYLTPAQLGGSDEMNNILFLPPEAAKRKQELDESLFYRFGAQCNYHAQVQYEKDSVIPRSITVWVNDEMERIVIW